MTEAVGDRLYDGHLDRLAIQLCQFFEIPPVLVEYKGLKNCNASLAMLPSSATS